MHPTVQATADAIRDAIDRLAPDDFARRRGPDRWSIAEILDHLLKTFAGSAYILRRAVEQNAPKGGRPTLGQRVSSWIVLDLGYFPTGVKTPAVALPSANPKPTVREDVLAALAQFDAAATAAEERFGSLTKLANHPVLGPFCARQWRQFHMVHASHHMKQIKRLIDRESGVGSRESGRGSGTL